MCTAQDVFANDTECNKGVLYCHRYSFLEFTMNGHNIWSFCLMVRVDLLTTDSFSRRKGAKSIIVVFLKLTFTNDAYIPLSMGLQSLFLFEIFGKNFIRLENINTENYMFF